jgi:hypothetical protein
MYALPLPLPLPQVDELPMRAMALQSALSEMPNDVSTLCLCHLMAS